MRASGGSGPNPSTTHLQASSEEALCAKVRVSWVCRDLPPSSFLTYKPTDRPTRKPGPVPEAQSLEPP